MGVKSGRGYSYIQCDRCNKKTERVYDEHHAMKAVSLASRQGWKFTLIGPIICPDCRQNKQRVKV